MTVFIGLGQSSGITTPGISEFVSVINPNLEVLL